MNILEHLNERLQIIDGGLCYGGEDVVKQVIKTSPISLPKDYIEFLKTISGKTNDGKESFGPEIGVNKEDCHTKKIKYKI